MGTTRSTGVFTAVPGRPTTIWDPRLVAVTLGAVALIFLAALQALAITTVMPIVSADLDGAALFAVAFSATLAASVIGMVATGIWADRSGPKRPLYLAVALFVAGLVLAGAAPTMEILVVGRIVQGLGIGGQTVALYVVVARVFPPELHGRVFAAFSAAWVVPSLVGPFLAGLVAEHLHWRWVFLGVAVLTVVAFSAVAVRLIAIDLSTTDAARASGAAGRILLAVAVAAAVLLLGLAGEFGPFMPLVAGGAVIVMGFAVWPLLPRRTFLAGRGLPSVVLMRGMIAGSLFGAEVYLPYVLMDDFGFSPSASGLGLTAAALAWAVAAWVQGRWGSAIGNRRISLIGCLLLAGAAGGVAATATWHLWPGLVVVAWLFAGAGMGLMYPRLTVLTLAYSTPRNQGFNSSALSISDSVGGAGVIAVMGLVFTALAGTGLGFPVVFALAAALALLALVPGLRLGHGAESR